MKHVVRVWDLPTRIFHWGLAACVIGLVITGHVGGNAMVVHFRLGFMVLALLGFRLCWGLVGGHWSRFSSFLFHPRTILAYARGEVEPAHKVGHNPLGSLSVFGLLGLLVAQVGSGLFSNDDIAFAGPLTAFVSELWVSRATWYHSGPGQIVVTVLVGLHLCAIVFYRVKRREDLVTPMLKGDKEVPAGLPSSRDSWGSRGMALVLLTAWIGVAMWVSGLGG